MKEKYFRPIVTNLAEIAHPTVITASPVLAALARKFFDAAPIEKKDGFKILEKK